MLTLLALIILTVHLMIARELISGADRLINLRQVIPVAPETFPSLSIVVAARNEEQQMEAALASLLSLDYPNLEVIAVNDRSTDNTGAILSRLKEQYPHLQTLDIDELPANWLGKNHALWQGSRIATGKLLLFTDADIHMAPDTLIRAVSLLEHQQIDHLALSPGLRMPGVLLSLLAATFGFLFGLYTRCWRVADPRNRYHIGIGAFNLVRASVYRQVGGHARICLRPDDDLKLGKIIKDWGYRQQFAYGHDFIRVQWYSSLREMVIGLEKNLFAGTDYQVGRTIGGVLAGFTLFVWPYVALLVVGGIPWLLSLLSVLILTLVLAISVLRFRSSVLQIVGFPLGVAILCIISLRTMLLNLRQGGINWRNTFYPLVQLRKNRV